MPVIHLCERCNTPSAYHHVGSDISDPLGQRGMPADKRFCNDCERTRAEIEQALRDYARDCLGAWEMRAAQPEAPQLWDQP